MVMKNLGQRERVQARTGGAGHALAAVRVRPAVGHGQDSGTVVPQRLVELVLKLSAPNGLATRPIACGERSACMTHGP